MKHFSNNQRFVIVLWTIFAIFLLGWIAENKSAESIDPIFINGESNTIKSIDAEFYDRKLLLNIHLKKEVQCEEVMKTLSIQPLVVKSKTYAPNCSHVNNLLIRITYSEAIEA